LRPRTTMVCFWHGGRPCGQGGRARGRSRIWGRDSHITVGETGSDPAYVRSICAQQGRTAWSLYAAASYVERKGAPAAPEDLRGHDAITFDDSLGAVPGALWLQEHGEGPISLCGATASWRC
jgi:hypothetical protein